MKRKDIYIVKIFEDLTINEFEHGSSHLRTGEPLAFVNRMMNACSDNVIHLHNSNVVRDANVLKNSNVLAEFNEKTLSMPANKDAEIVLILWQGLRGNAIANMIKSYKAYAKLQEEFKDYTNVREYFLMTDLRCPLFKVPEVHIETSNMTLLSQAKLDYRHDLQNIFDSNVTDSVKGWYGNESYTNFKDFQHLELHTLVATERVYLPKNVDINFVSQGYAAMQQFRRQVFRSITTNVSLNDTYSIKIYGNINEADIDLMNADSGNAEIRSELCGFIEWRELTKVLAKSRFSICANNAKYDEYGLIPNRVVESISAGCLPIFVNCDAAKRIPELHEYVFVNALQSDETFIEELKNSLEVFSINDYYELTLTTLFDWLQSEISSFDSKLKTL